jgi:hypothetical protein
MSISEHFRYRNDVFQSDIFVSDIGITYVDVGCRISPTLRSMSMPTYVNPHTLLKIYQCKSLYLVMGKLLVKSSGVILLPSLVKVTFNPSPIFQCNGSITVTSY